ncbi:glutamate ABC transporter substrate-binding protein [Brevibacterium litoralis]|uniref:glutamate ABC transporter substrate-binding protein n=1 Tax=Brevibacterium litoralis TaxID=3138935 RepID=UPI0032EFBDA1
MTITKRFGKATAWKASAVAGVLVLTLAGCGQSGSPTSDEAESEGGGEAPTYTLAEDFSLEGSPTWDTITENGTIRIGMAFDAPGLSYKGTTDDVPAGYNAEVAKVIVAGLGLEEDQIEYVESVTANREPFLQNGQVDMVVSSYTINDERKQVVDFAGPYFTAGQDLLVPDDSDITSSDDLAGKSVCATVGSTPAQNIEANFPDTELVTYDGNSKCFQDLQSGNIDAMTTDDIVLRGFAATDEGYHVIGETFTDEPYGVGLPKGDDVFRDAVNDILEAGAEGGNGDLLAAWEYSFGGPDGYQDPEVDRY